MREKSFNHPVLRLSQSETSRNSVRKVVIRMKKTLNQIFDEANANELDILIRQNPVSDVPDETLSSVRNKVYAKAGLPEAKAKKSRTCRWLYVAAAMLAVCVIAALPILGPSLRSPSSPVIIPPENETCPETSVNGTESSVNNPMDARTGEPIVPPDAELPLWGIVADSPFAIYKIHEITDEKITLSQNPTGMQDCCYVKVSGEIVAAYHTEAFAEGNPVLDGSGIEPLPFENAAAIYFTENTVPMLHPGDTVLFYVIRMNMNGQYYYGPATNMMELSEVLPIENGKLRIKPEDFNTWSFSNLQILNKAVRDRQGFADTGFPTTCVEDGMTLEDLTAFFQSWDSVPRTYWEWQKQHPNVDF